MCGTTYKEGNSHIGGHGYPHFNQQQMWPESPALMSAARKKHVGSRDLLSFMLMESGSRPHGHVRLKVLIRPGDGGDGGSNKLWRERHKIFLVGDNVNFFMLMANYSELIILNTYYCQPSYCLWIFIISLEIKNISI